MSDTGTPDSGSQGGPSYPLPPGRPPSTSPPGTPDLRPPHDAAWVPPTGTALGGGPDVLAGSERESRDPNARATATLPDPAADAGHAAEARADKEQSGRAVPFLLAVAAVVAAIVTARASLLSSDATSAWQGSVAQEQRRGAMLLEGVRYTYGAEGDMVFMIVSADIQAQELQILAAGQPPGVSAALESEAKVQQQLVDLVGPSSELYADERYRLDSGGVDLQLRLADSRIEDDDTADPLVTLAIGDDASVRATRLMQATLAIGAAFLFGALAQTFRGRRRMSLGLGWVALATGTAVAVSIEAGLLGIAA